MKKLLSVLLCVMMVACFMPSMAFAETVESCGNGDTCEEHEARIGTTHYTTIEEAFEAVKSNDTITLLTDATVEAGLTIESGVTGVVLDLGDNTIKRVNSKGIFNVYGSLTIQNGTVLMEQAELSKNAILIGNGGSLTVAQDAIINTSVASPKGAYDSDCFAITLAKANSTLVFNGKIIGESGIIVNGTNTGTNSITIGSTADINVSKYGLYQAGTCTTTVKAGAKIVGGTTGIEVRAGSLTVEDDTSATTTITGSGTTFSVTPNDGGETTAGAGIAVAQHTTKQDITVTIAGGHIKGAKALTVNDPQNNQSENVTVTVTGGYFTTDPSEYVSEDKVAVKGNYEGGYSYTIQSLETVEAGKTDVDKKATVSMPANTTMTVEKIQTAAAGITADDSLESFATAQAGDILASAGLNDALIREVLDNKATGYKDDDELTITITPYFAVTPKSYAESDEGEKAVTFDIKAKYTIEAKSSSMGADEEAVSVEEGTLNVTEPVEIKAALPDGFVTGTNDIFVTHKGYEYTATVSDNGGTYYATFTNPHGFSEFTFSTKSAAVAEITETNTSYTSLQDAVNDVQDGQTIKLLYNNEENVTVSKAVTFTLDKNGKDFDGSITNAYGYTVTPGEDGAYTVTKNPYYYVPSTPSTDDSAVDTPADEETAAAIAAVEATKLKAQTKLVKVNGKAAIKVTWKAADGSDLDLDGVEIFRSVKRYSGYTAKPIFTTTKAQYYNTAVKAGTKYYYKVRGYKVVDGEKVYTEFSTKAWRTVK